MLEELVLAKDGSLARACDKAKVDVVPVGAPVIITDYVGAWQLKRNEMLEKAPEGATAFVVGGRYDPDGDKPFIDSRVFHQRFRNPVLAVQYYKQAKEGQDKS